MAIKSLGYIGVNSQQTDAWREFACHVMGLEDVSARCEAEPDEAYFKMDDHPYRLFVTPGEAETLQVCGWETNSAEGLQEVADALSTAGVDFTWGDNALLTVDGCKIYCVSKTLPGTSTKPFGVWSLILESLTRRRVYEISSPASKAWATLCSRPPTLMRQ